MYYLYTRIYLQLCKTMCLPSVSLQSFSRANEMRRYSERDATTWSTFERTNMRRHSSLLLLGSNSQALGPRVSEARVDQTGLCFVGRPWMGAGSHAWTGHVQRHATSRSIFWWDDASVGERRSSKAGFSCHCYDKEKTEIMAEESTADVYRWKGEKNVCISCIFVLKFCH